MNTGTNKPSTYRDMCVPHESEQALSDALQAFFKSLYELRKEHRIADIHFVVKSSAMADDGAEQTMMVSYHIGNELEAESMLAYALGRASSERKERIGKLLTGAGVHHKQVQKTADSLFAD